MCQQTYLALTKGPEVNHDADDVVQRGVGGLIHQGAGERAQRVKDQARLKVPMQGREEAGQVRQWGFDAQDDEGEDEVGDLQVRERFDGAVEVFRHEVEEDLRPEEALETRG